MMKEFPKIDTCFKRDPENLKRLIEGDWANPIFGYLANNKWVFTEKVDGTTIRVMIPTQEGKNTIRYGGKTDNAQISAKLVTRLHDMFLPQVPKMYEMFPSGACLYGEGYGAGIQKGGGNYHQDQNFILFDVLVNDPDHDRQWWLERHNIEDVAHKLGLDVVPIINKGTLHDMVAMARTGFTSTWGTFKAEGIVARPEVELKDRSGKRIITKIKHRDFSTGGKHEDSITE